MNRAARRKIERQLRKIIKTDGDVCSLCRVEFPHNSRTYGGITADGTVAFVGECCAEKLEIIVISGLITTKPYDVPSRNGRSRKQPATNEQIAEAIDAHQKYFAMADQFAARVSPHRQGVVTFSERPWKTDDQIWFKANPDRSHRLRQLFPGELATLRRHPEEPDLIPAGHEPQVLVRQVEPGKRIRISFYRNLAIDIPDIEPLLHAMFDLVSGDRTDAISTGEVAKLALKYAASSVVVS